MGQKVNTPSTPQSPARTWNVRHWGGTRAANGGGATKRRPSNEKGRATWRGVHEAPAIIRTGSCDMEGGLLSARYFHGQRFVYYLIYPRSTGHQTKRVVRHGGGSFKQQVRRQANQLHCRPGATPVPASLGPRWGQWCRWGIYMIFTVKM